MIDTFKFKSVSQDHFLSLRISATSVYFGELTFTDDRGEQLNLFPSTHGLSDILGNPKIRKDRNGFGVQLFLGPSGCITSKMEGFWVDNRLHGSCNLTFPSSAEYQGKLIGNKREGYGKLTFPTGTTYQGFWHHDCMEGPGVFTSEATQLQGNFVNNLFVAKNHAFLNPFVSGEKIASNPKYQQTCAQTREHNIHLKNYRLLETRRATEAVVFGQKSFENDRFCFLISQINSGWDFQRVVGGLEGVRTAVVDCQRIESEFLERRAEFPGLMEEVKGQMRRVLEEGGVILVNIDDSPLREAQKVLDVDFQALISTHRVLEGLFNLNKLKKTHLLPNDIGLTRLSTDVSVLLFSKWKLPRDLRPALARQQVSNRFQYICNVHWGDTIILS